MTVASKPNVAGQKTFIQKVGSFFYELAILLFNYFFSWAIVIFGLMVVFWPQIQSRNINNVSMDVVYQGIGITVILYGLNRVLKKSIGLGGDNEQRKRDEKILAELSALRKLIEEKK